MQYVLVIETQDDSDGIDGVGCDVDYAASMVNDLLRNAPIEMTARPISELLSC